MLVESINYREPDSYRAKIPGYKKEINLLQVNTKMVKKILKVKQNNEVGMASIGGASGISSMLSRAHNTLIKKEMSFSDQQDSVNRLYKMAQIVTSEHV